LLLSTIRYLRRTKRQTLVEQQAAREQRASLGYRDAPCTITGQVCLLLVSLSNTNRVALMPSVLLGVLVAVRAIDRGSVRVAVLVSAIRRLLSGR
jgi:hypothetical protein